MQKNLAGNLAIIGGNKLGFAGVAAAYSAALDAGVGQVRLLLPDSLKKTVPRTMNEALFGASTPSGGLSKEARPELLALCSWAQHVLLIGDAGRNSETAIAYEDFIQNYSGPLTITRDAVDLVKNNPTLIAERPYTTLVVSFSQLQKLFQALYYPKVLTFSMQLAYLVEALHKFTLTFPVQLCVLHKDTLLVAYEGQVVSQRWDAPMKIWRGDVAAKVAAYQTFSPATQHFEATVSSIYTQ